MEAGQVYVFSDASQFWSELGELLNVGRAASLESMDYACRNFIAFVARYIDTEYLATPAAFDAALLMLLDSEIFHDHVDRMTNNVMSFIDDQTDPPALYVALVLILHLGMSNSQQHQSANGRSVLEPGNIVVSNSKVFKGLRRRWETVTPVLKRLVATSHPLEHHHQNSNDTGDTVSGWEERLGTTACAVLYEVCRVQKLTRDELRSFDYDFIVRLFALVEQTRYAEDETFNYLLIKLLIALNEQFMVAVLPPSANGNHGNGSLPPPIEPVIKHDKPDRSQQNLVLEILKNGEVESKTFGENIIFILNRANAASDSLSVSLLVLKLLYLLFTTSSTAEYFYTNDLCVLVDVFIRELSDLGPESEGLRHTYLRVLHPLMTKTQLRHHPYKRDLLYKVLKGLISHSNYQICDATTRRLVERNLKSAWSDELRENDPTCPNLNHSPRRKSGTPSSASHGSSSNKSLFPSDNLLGQSLSIERVGSSVSLNAIADANDAPPYPLSPKQRASFSSGSHHNHFRTRTGSIDASHSLPRSLPSSVCPSPRSHSPAAFLDPNAAAPNRARSSSLSAVPFDDTTSNSIHAVNGVAVTSGRRRRAAPPPPVSSSASAIHSPIEPTTTLTRPRTPAGSSPLISVQSLPPSSSSTTPVVSIPDENATNGTNYGHGTGQTTGKRRAAPLPPVKRFDDLRLS